MTKRTPPVRVPTKREYLIMVMVALGVIVTVMLINFFVGDSWGLENDVVTEP